MAKLSVIMPVYNTQKYLKKSLDSLVNQTFKDLEIIIVNDGSTDNSQKIIDEYKKKYKNIKAYTIKNSGVSVARNEGIKKASSDYITFLDSDDYVDLDLYEKMYNKIDKDTDVVECDFIWEYPNNRRYDVLNKDIHPLLAVRAVVWNRIYKKDIITKNNIYFKKGVYYEDIEFCYEIFPYLKNKKYVNNAYVHYMQRDGSITTCKTDKLKDVFTVLDGTIKYYKDNNLYDEYKDELEFLYVRYTLGSSFYRIVKTDKKLRNALLDYSYDKLINAYPSFKKNKYVRRFGLKNLFYMLTNKTTLKFFGEVFSVIKK